MAGCGLNEDLFFSSFLFSYIKESPFTQQEGSWKDVPHFFKLWNKVFTIPSIYHLMYTLRTEVQDVSLNSSLFHQPINRIRGVLNSIDRELAQK